MGEKRSGHDHRQSLESGAPLLQGQVQLCHKDTPWSHRIFTAEAAKDGGRTKNQEEVENQGHVWLCVPSAYSN